MSALRRVLALGAPVRGRLVGATLLGAAASAAAVALTGVSAWLISRADEHPPVLHLMVAIVAVRTFGIARGALRYGERIAAHDASFRVLTELRVATVQRLERILPGARVSNGRPLRSGDLLARFVDDVDAMQDLWVRVALPYGAAALVGVGTVGALARMVPGAASAVALSVLAAAVLAPALAVRAAQGAGRTVAPLRAEHHDRVLDLLDGATELLVCGALDGRLDELARTDAELAHAEARSASARGFGAAIAVLAAGAATWAALWLGADHVSVGTLAPASLAVVVLVPGALHEIIAGLATSAQLVPALRGSASRLDEVLRLPDAVAEPVDPVPLPSGPYGVRMRGVVAGWPGGDVSTHAPSPAPVLRGLDLEVRAGECVVISGPSGSGKSTIAAVLLRLLDVDEGELIVDGVDGQADLRSVQGDDVRRIIGWCAQDAYVFDSTIAANLRLARPDASEAQLHEALARAQLLAWVTALPDGLATMVGEHGGAISGGQRQRLALARTLLADRRVIVFDEPTENLDEDTARSLAFDLVAATEGRTTIVLTHRPELFPEPRHLVLGEGRLQPVGRDATRAATSDGSHTGENGGA